LARLRTAQVVDLSGCGLLDEVDVLWRGQLETGVQLLRLVSEFAHQHGGGMVDAERARLPGRERAVRLGGEGTPLVAEFAPSVLAARLELSAYAGGRLVADVLDLQYRLPRLSARDSFAKATRSTEHGMRGFYVRADFATIARVDATVAYLAQAVQILQAYAAWQRQGGSTSSTTEESSPTREGSPIVPERFDPTEAAELLDEEKLLPVVWLFAHLAGSSVGRVEGAEPVTAEWVRQHLGERCRFKITPVLDPLDQVPVDAWEIPHRHRQAVHLLTPADTFPFASNTTRDKQRTSAQQRH
jgi:hypothetical protein